MKKVDDKTFVEALAALVRVYEGRNGDCIRLSVDDLNRLVALARYGTLYRNDDG